MAYAASGAKVTAALINGIFPAILGLFTKANAPDSGTTISTTYSATLTGATTVGPTVTITSTGTLALVLYKCRCHVGTAGSGIQASVAVSGATTIAATTNETNGDFLQNTATTGASVSGFMLLSITPGTNTYTMQYRSSSAVTATFDERQILVLAP